MMRSRSLWASIISSLGLSAMVGSLFLLVGSATAEPLGKGFVPLALQPIHSTSQVPYPASRSQLLVQAHKGLVTPPFPAIIARLQSLGYLPIARAFIQGKSGIRVRHDAFLWPVPKVLQQTADQYAWNAANPFIRGAIVQFERCNGILGPRGLSEGRLHPAVIRKLFSKTARKDPWSWEWVLVNKAIGTPILESLHVWEHGSHRVPQSWSGHPKGLLVRSGWVWKTVVNTGVLGSTPNGTYPVYQRLPRTTMRGIFPIPVSWKTYVQLKGQQVPAWLGAHYKVSARGIVNGHPVRWQPYDDPGILWVNYFDDGRGIHYYPRAAYGFPQSAGCVEEPYHNAPITYRLLHYGVPVTISGAVFS